VRLLVLTTRLFRTPSSGGEICTARLLGGLRERGHHVVLIGRGDATAAAAWAATVVSVGGVEGPFDEQTVAQRARAALGALAGGEAITTHRHGRPRAAEIVAPWWSQADAVVVDHLQVWPWLAGRRDKPLMLVQHNAESDNYLRRAGAEGLSSPDARPGPTTRWPVRYLMRREGRLLLKLELDALQHATELACLSDADAARMVELARLAGSTPKARISVLPGYPLDLRAPRDPVARAPAVPRVGLIGTWTWAPNREGLHWLLDKVWPMLQGRAQLVLAGSGLELLDLPPGATVLGRVDDVARFHEQIDLIAVPSHSGSGVLEKAIEAVASGLPVVATSHALRGLEGGLPGSVWPADEPKAFADACLAAASPAAAETGSVEAIRRWALRRRHRYQEALGACLRGLSTGRTPSATTASSALESSLP
jgi:polysaccharide biosynthesis protein PslH